MSAYNTSRFMNLTNDSQRLGYFMATLEALVKDADHYDHAESEIERKCRREMYDWSMKNAKQALEDMQAYQRSFLAVADSASVDSTSHLDNKKIERMVFGAFDAEVK